MFRNIKNLFSNKYKNNIHNFQTRSYEGAVKNNIISWYTPTSLTPNYTLGKNQETLRDRARDLVRNNAYAQRAVTAITSNVIGTGIIHKFSNFEQDIWDEWANSLHCDANETNTYYGLQALVNREMVEAGECFIKKVFTNFDGINIPLKLRILGAEYLDTSRNGFLNGVNYVSQGIEYDPLGNKVAFYLYPFLPENDLGYRLPSERVSASEICHVFKSDRAGQNRGVTWFAPVMMEFKNLDNYQNAELKRREVSACFAAFVKTPDGDTSLGQVKDKDKNTEFFKLTPGAVYHLLAGQDITFSTPQSDATYDQYISSVIRKIGLGIGVPYEIISGNLSKVNFSSGRMGYLEFQRNIDFWRWNTIIPQFCETISKWFLEAAFLCGYETSLAKVSYTPPMREMIDPAKEILAMKNSIRNGLKSYHEALRELGYNPEKVIKEIAESNKMLDENKILLDSDPRYTGGQGNLQIKQANSKKRKTNEVSNLCN